MPTPTVQARDIKTATAGQTSFTVNIVPYAYPATSPFQIQAWVNGVPAVVTSCAAAGSTQSTVHIAAGANAGDRVDFIRVTPRDVSNLPGTVQPNESYLLCLAQETAAASNALGQQQNPTDFWITNTAGAPAIQLFPDILTTGPLADPNGMNAGLAGPSRLRFQTQLDAGTGSSTTAGWFSAYLQNSGTPTAPADFSTLSVLMRTNAGLSGTNNAQSGTSLQVASSIAASATGAQKYGKAEALVISARHEAFDSTHISDGVLIGALSTVQSLGADTGTGYPGGQVSPPKYENYAFAANSNGVNPGFMAFVAKTDDLGGIKGNGWYNGFVVASDVIQADTGGNYGRAFWYVNRFAIQPKTEPNPDGGTLSTSRAAFGHDAPLAPCHVKYPGLTELRLENYAPNGTKNTTVSQITFWGKGTSSTASNSIELGRVMCQITDTAVGSEDSRFQFRIISNATPKNVWNVGLGIYSQGATLNDCGIHSINIGTASPTTDGYYFAGKRVLWQRKTGWKSCTTTGGRGNFNAGTVTATDLPLLADSLGNLINDLIAHGLIEWT